MRFAHINHRYSPFVGGSERYMQEVSEVLAGFGHAVTVVTSDAFDLEYLWDSKRRQIDAPAIEELNGVSVYRVPVHHGLASPIVFQGSRRLLAEMSRIPSPVWPFRSASKRLPSLPRLPFVLRKTGPYDLVHAANLGLEGLGIHGLDAARASDSPFIFTPFIHLGRPGDVVAQRYVSMPQQRELLRAANAVIVMTQLEASFVESLGVDRSRVFISGVGINLEEVCGGHAERFRHRFGVTGRLVGVASAVAFDKGSRELLLAVSRLRRAGHSVELVLAGPRLKQFDDWLEHLDPRDLEGIHIPGFISADDKRDMLAAIDILAMPSRTESFGIAYLEGWANHKPVIAANAGAVPEIVRDGENGLLVEFGDIDGLAARILDVLSDSQLASRLGRTGNALTLANYTWMHVMNRVMDAYSYALGFDLVGSGHNG
jgi:glycosyltransferase involved in cell wall biosynthesis